VIRPAEIRALYSKLVEGGPHPKDDPRQILAEALRSEMGRVWESASVSLWELKFRVGNRGGNCFYIEIQWKDIPFALVFPDRVEIRDKRFFVNVDNKDFFVGRYLADEWPELKKPEVATGA